MICGFYDNVGEPPRDVCAVDRVEPVIKRRVPRRFTVVPFELLSEVPVCPVDDVAEYELVRVRGHEPFYLRRK